MSNNFCVSYAYGKASDRFEHGGDLVFSSENLETAKAEFKLWWDGRHRIMPDLFKELWAVKIYNHVPQPLTGGNYTPPTNMWLYEWKYDWGWEYGT